VVTRLHTQVVSALMKKELRGLVEERPTAAWRETLALLCTYAPKAQWAELTEALAEQLATAGDTLAATLCFITAGAVEKAAAIWVRNPNPNLCDVDVAGELQP